MEVKDIRENMRNVDVVVKVVDVSEKKEVTSRRDGRAHTVVEVLAGDETGVVMLSLWDEDIKYAEEGKVLKITNGYTTVFKGNIRLNIGKYGKIEEIEEDFDVNTENNVSERKVYAPRRYDFPRRLNF